jgi:signal transduction histidine kinase
MGDKVAYPLRKQVAGYVTITPTRLPMTHDIIVKQHGGSINVETEPGVFTDFIITLPRGGTAKHEV